MPSCRDGAAVSRGAFAPATVSGGRCGRVLPDWRHAGADWYCRRGSGLGRAEVGKREGYSVRPFVANEGVEWSGSCVLVVSFGRVARFARWRADEAILALEGFGALSHLWGSVRPVSCCVPASGRMARVHDSRWWHRWWRFARWGEWRPWFWTGGS